MEEWWEEMKRVEEEGWRIVGRGMGRVEEEGKKEMERVEEEGWRNVEEEWGGSMRRDEGVVK